MILYFSHTRQVEIDVHDIRELIVKELLVVNYVPTMHQNVYILTKPLFALKSKHLRDKLKVPDWCET